MTLNTGAPVTPTASGVQPPGDVDAGRTIRIHGEVYADRDGDVWYVRDRQAYAVTDHGRVEGVVYPVALRDAVELWGPFVRLVPETV